MKSNTWVGLVWAGCLMGMAGVGAAYDDLTVLSDEFDTAESTSAWSRVVYTEGWNNDALEVFDSNTTRPGHLVMTPFTSSWFGEFRGELTYKMVSGDFVITTFVEPRNRAGTGRPERDYSLAGIMVRQPRSMTDPSQWTPEGQNYVVLSMGSADRQSPGFEYEVKTTSNSVSTLVIEGTDATRAAIQVARLGDHFIMLRQNEGEEWVVHRRYARPDFPETVQAGLTVYTDWATVGSVGVENNNLLVLTNGVELIGGGTLGWAEPDLVAAFDYVRFARPLIPEALEAAAFSDPSAVTDLDLLSFLGETANVPGGAHLSPEWTGLPEVTEETIRCFATGFVTQRTYRVQSWSPVAGWNDELSLVSTNSVLHYDHPRSETDENVLFFRIASP